MTGRVQNLKIQSPRAVEERKVAPAWSALYKAAKSVDGLFCLEQLAVSEIWNKYEETVIKFVEAHQYPYDKRQS